MFIFPPYVLWLYLQQQCKCSSVRCLHTVINRSFYFLPNDIRSHPESVLIPHLIGDTNYVVTDCCETE